jgi:hypothetical protein
MIDINKLKLTDMGNPELIPQLVEEMNTKFIKEEEKIICEKLFDLDIDKDILINQTQEINRLNDILREYKELEEQGLLLKLPCKVGDIIYEIVNDEIISFSFQKQWRIARYLEAGIFGKIAFLTKEEAEKALLKRLEGAE